MDDFNTHFEILPFALLPTIHLLPFVLLPTIVDPNEFANLHF